MTSPLNWFLDFDDTLATGSMTWSLEQAFPRLIHDYQLAHDPVRFMEAVEIAQEKTSRDISAEQVVHDLFLTMGWPTALERTLFRDVLSNYQPALFEDALSFLERLRALNKRAFVLSNNQLAFGFVSQLQIEGYVTGVYTPNRHPGTFPKPHRSLWDVIVAADAQVGADNSAFVGDDPWTDGGFAENCGLPCWIVDRQARFGHLHDVKPYGWVSTLLDIPLS